MTLIEIIAWLVDEVQRLSRKVDGVTGRGVMNVGDSLVLGGIRGNRTSATQQQQAAPSVSFGRMKESYVTGNVVTLRPCDDAGVEIEEADDVEALIVWPSGASPSGVSLSTDDLVVYSTAPDGTAFLLPVKQGGAGGGFAVGTAYNTGNILEESPADTLVFKNQTSKDRYVLQVEPTTHNIIFDKVRAT